MRKTSLLPLTLLISIFLSAQTPQAVNYQAIARNSLGQIIPSQPIGVRFTITDSTGNTIYYQETHATTTNNFGLFTLAIGRGTATSGSIPGIDWASGGKKLLKVEIAPQGGSNYTMQGSTQLLSVPYALYSEKTKLVAGPGISITNGNTISSNLNAWLLNGNAGTTVANFLGTTDNQPLQIKTNNTTRVSIDAGTPDPFWGSVSTLSISNFNSLATAPGQLAVYGRDIPGISMPAYFANSIQGMNWAPQGGSNNTMGRFFRLLQNTTNNILDGRFYDFGMDQGQSFFISEQGLQGGGPTFFKKMITISPQDYVGINFGWGENPTANFHTKGTVRFEGITSNDALTRVLVMDNNGNISSRDASTLGGGSGGSGWSLTGNGATTTANFLGTSDNNPLNIRTNNVQRISIGGSNPAGGIDFSMIQIGQQSDLVTKPDQLSVWGKDMSGYLIPFRVTGSVAGMNWSPNGDPNNTMGRLMRLAQFTNPTGDNYQFFDMGIDQAGDYYLSEHAMWSDANITPKKMLTISPQNFVGINFDWGENPTANFHTKGTVRFQNLPSGTGNVLVVDANGNVFRASQIASRTPADNDAIHSLQKQLDDAKREIADLKVLISAIQKQLNSPVK